MSRKSTILVLIALAACVFCLLLSMKIVNRNTASIPSHSNPIVLRIHLVGDDGIVLNELDNPSKAYSLFIGLPRSESLYKILTSVYCIDFSHFRSEMTIEFADLEDGGHKTGPIQSLSYIDGNWILRNDEHTFLIDSDLSPKEMFNSFTE